MKLKNKKTGEIGELQITEKHCAVAVGNGTASCGIEIYTSLAELNAEWEDAPEEPKDYWWISPVDTDVVHCVEDVKDEMDQYNKEIGNYFETKEEAEKAVEKLKAFKRLKDKGFEFCCDIRYESLCGNGFNIPLDAIMPPEAYTDVEVSEDLDICFGGEE